MIKKWLVMIGVILLALFISFAEASTCNDDINSDICRLITSPYVSVVDLCEDTCVSKICANTCGKCPLQCYQCHNVSNPSDCLTKTTCPTADHYCVSTQTYNDDFEKTYKLGCATKDTCSRNFHNDEIGVIIGKRDNYETRSTRLEGSCCQTDLCNNNHNHLDKRTNILSVVTTPLSTSNTTIEGNGSCSDINSEICYKMKTMMPNMCDNNCIATNICPRTCQLCVSCYNCTYSTTPNACNDSQVCAPNQHCYLLKTLTLSLEKGYRLGCMDLAVCKNLSFGEIPSVQHRQGFQTSFRGECCHEDLCNSQFNSPVPSNIPTTVPITYPDSCHHYHHHYTKCPDEFKKVNETCYHFGHHSMNWDAAKSYCVSICGQLADFNDYQSLQNVMSYFNHYGSHYDNEKTYYVGAIFDQYTSQWKWLSSSQDVDFHMISPDRGTGLCTAVHATRSSRPSHHHSTSHYNFILEKSGCTELRYPMCKANLQ